MSNQLQQSTLQAVHGLLVIIDKAGERYGRLMEPLGDLPMEKANFVESLKSMEAQLAGKKPVADSACFFLISLYGVIRPLYAASFITLPLSVAITSIPWDMECIERKVADYPLVAQRLTPLELWTGLSMIPDNEARMAINLSETHFAELLTAYSGNREDDFCSLVDNNDLLRISNSVILSIAQKQASSLLSTPNQTLPDEASKLMEMVFPEHEELMGKAQLLMQPGTASEEVAFNFLELSETALNHILAHDVFLIENKLLSGRKKQKLLSDLYAAYNVLGVTPGARTVAFGADDLLDLIQVSPDVFEIVLHLIQDKSGKGKAFSGDSAEKGTENISAAVHPLSYETLNKSIAFNYNLRNRKESHQYSMAIGLLYRFLTATLRDEELDAFKGIDLYHVERIDQTKTSPNDFAYLMEDNEADHARISQQPKIYWKGQQSSVLEFLYACFVGEKKDNLRTPISVKNKIALNMVIPTKGKHKGEYTPMEKLSSNSKDVEKGRCEWNDVFDRIRNLVEKRAKEVNK